MNQGSRSRSAVRPLTKIHKKTGLPYVRPSGVEADIEACIHWPLHQAFGLASQGKLRPQALVYLLRHFRPNGPSPDYDSAYIALFSRIKRIGEPLIRNFSELNRERIHDEVRDKVLKWWDTEAMDALEMGFRRTVECLYLTALAKIDVRRSTEISQEDFVDTDTGESGESIADALGLVHRGSAPPLAELSAELSQLMDVFTENEKLAITYVFALGLTEKEAGEQMKCSDRHVRNHLKIVRDKAQEMKRKGAQVARVER